MARKGEAKKFFEETVLKYVGDDCLSWPYSKFRGYGQVWHHGRVRLVPRIACEIVNGPPPSPAHEAAHTCGQGHMSCCNPRHLAWKTKLENEADKLVHGTVTIGSRNGRAILSEETVEDIRRKSERLSTPVLAAEFGISARHVRKIVTGVLWKSRKAA